MKLRARILLTAFSALSLGAIACGDADEEVPAEETRVSTIAPSPTPVPALTPGPGTTVWRWGNLTIAVPDSPDIYVKQDSWVPDEYPPSGGLVLWVMRGDIYGDGALSSLVLDAETGSIVREEVRSEEDKQLFEAIKGSAKTGPLNPVTAPWPFKGEPDASLPRESWGEISFLRPNPGAGLAVILSLNDPGAEGVTLTDGRFGVAVYLDENGKLAVNTELLIAAEDKEPFEAWLEEVTLCEVDAQC